MPYREAFMAASIAGRPFKRPNPMVVKFANAFGVYTKDRFEYVFVSRMIQLCARTLRIPVEGSSGIIGGQLLAAVRVAASAMGRIEKRMIISV
jgi:hypothetical protein